MGAHILDRGHLGVSPLAIIPRPSARLSWQLYMSLSLTLGLDDHRSEPDGVDRGWSRALLPFALSERNANCVHNGLLLVAFQQDAVSGARFQIT